MGQLLPNKNKTLQCATVLLQCTGFRRRRIRGRTKRGLNFLCVPSNPQLEMLPCNVQKWRGNEHTLAVCLHIIIYRLSHAWGDGHGQIHFPKVQRCSRFLAHSTRPRNAGACSATASLIGLLQHTTAPPFHCAAQHNRHMRRDLAVLAPAHGSSPHFSPSLCSLVSLQHKTHQHAHPSPLSRPLTQSQTISPLPS